jgi:Uma2 family endonuclease
MAVAVAIKRWTLEELHSLPNDGNKYELVRGELFVTPPPGDRHETIAARLNGLLAPYVAEHGLGLVFRPKAVMRFAGSEVEPDLMVRQPHRNRSNDDSDWDSAPVPILVVEILSDYTRRRDMTEKRQLYADAGVAEYWIVDADRRSITVIGATPTRVETKLMTWAPERATVPLAFAVQDIL